MDRSRSSLPLSDITDPALTVRPSTCAVCGGSDIRVFPPAPGHSSNYDVHCGSCAARAWLADDGTVGWTKSWSDNPARVLRGLLGDPLSPLDREALREIEAACDEDVHPNT